MLAQPAEQPLELLLGVGEVALQHDAGRRRHARTRASLSSSSTSSVMLSRVSSDSMSMCRCAPESRASRSSVSSRSRAASSARAGALARRCGVSAETLTLRLGRGKRAEAVVLEQRTALPAGAHPRELAQRVGAACRVDRALGFGQSRLAEQIERHAAALLPQRSQFGGRRRGVLAGDEAVRHLRDTERGGRGGRQLERAPADEAREPPRGPGAAITDGGLLEVLVQVPHELATVAAGGAHVDEAKQRGPQPRVADHRLHHPPLGQRRRIAPRARQLLGEPPPPGVHL